MPDGISDIIVADRISDANQVRIPSTSNLQVSWEISRAGQLSCEVPYADLTAVGVTPDMLLRKWIHYTHPTAGPWGGQIVGTAGGDTPGIITINAESWASCLRGVFASGLSHQTVTYPNYVKLAIEANTAVTGIKTSATSSVLFGTVNLMEDSWDIYDTSLPYVLEFYEIQREEYHFLPLGYNVDPVTRIFTISDAIGTDRSATVKLADRVHNVESQWSDDASDFTNYLVLSGNYNVQTPYNSPLPPKVVCDKYKGKGKKKVCVKSHEEARSETKYRTDKSSGTVVALNQASINRYGRVTATFEAQYGFSSLTEMQAAARSILSWRVTNQQLVSITCTDQDGIWSQFREGDVIAVDLSLSGLVGRMVVRARAVDVSRGTMIVAGEAELRRVS